MEKQQSPAPQVVYLTTHALPRNVFFSLLSRFKASNSSHNQKYQNLKGCVCVCKEGKKEEERKEEEEEGCKQLTESRFQPRNMFFSFSHVLFLRSLNLYTVFFFLAL